MKPGDLVRADRFNAIGIVADIFGDLDPDNPWVRVVFTHPVQTYRWCKANSLVLINKKGSHDGSLSVVDPTSGSL